MAAQRRDERLVTGLPDEELVHFSSPVAQVVAPCLVDDHGWAQSTSIEDGVMGAATSYSRDKSRTAPRSALVAIAAYARSAVDT